MPTAKFVEWLSGEVLPRLAKVEERAKLGSWFEQRARLIEANEHKPHNALKLLELLDVSCQMPDTKRIGTPAQYVEYTIARANTSTYSTFGVNTSLSHRVASTLRVQLEDLVYLWDNHDYRISLADYSRETQTSIGERSLAPCFLLPPKRLHCWIELLLQNFWQMKFKSHSVPMLPDTIWRQTRSWWNIAMR